MKRATTVLEDYFEFLDPDDIRIKGHRIGIDGGKFNFPPKSVLLAPGML